MAMPTPVPEMVEDTKGKGVGQTQRVRASLNFVPWASLPSPSASPVSYLDGCLERQAGPGGGGQLSTGIGVYA